MSGNRFLVDTNIFIYLTQGNKPVADFLQDKDLAVSVITAMELLSYPDITETDTKLLEEMLEQCEMIEVSTVISRRAILIRRKWRIELPDAIIAATKWVTGYPLITADKDFNKIPDKTIILLEI